MDTTPGQSKLYSLLSPILLDQAQRWQRGDKVLAEFYLDQNPLLRSNQDALLDLIYNEILLRQKHAEAPRLEDYLQRFPELALPLEVQFAVERAMAEPDDSPGTIPGSPGSRTLLQAAVLGRSAVGAQEDPGTIAGYEIVAELGRGAMGVVYQAWQKKLHRMVALKMVLAGSQASAVELARFRTEAEAVARLQHPNIVQVHEVGEQDGRPFLALEFVDGGSLAQKLQGAPLPARPAAQLIEILARAAHEAHQKGIVHRDLKPANILLQRKSVSSLAGGRPMSEPERVPADSDCGLRIADYEPKITDFGLAKLLIGGAGQTQTGVILGTPTYMAPEQASGRPMEVGQGADIYALGAMLYELLTGRPPFRGETVTDTLQQILLQEPVPPRRLQPKVPRDLETICLKCLNKETWRRYPTAHELADELDRFLHHHPIRARPVGAWVRLGRWCRRNPALAAVTGLALTTLLAAIAVAVSFALYQRSAAERLAGTLNEVESQREQALWQQHQAELAAAQLALTQGVTLCAHGEPELGILWLARSMEMMPAGTEDRRASIRRLVGAWSRDLSPLKKVIATDNIIRAVAYRADGKVVLSGGLDHTARLWDVATGKPLDPVFRHGQPITAVAFVDTRRVMTAGVDGTAQLWDAATGQRLGLPLSHDAEVTCLAISPDGKTVATGSLDHKARLWDVDKGKLIGQPLQHLDLVRAVAFSPGGDKLLTGSADKLARIWEVPTGKLLTERLVHQAMVRAVAWGPDGTLATGGQDQTIQFWNAQGQPLGSPLPHGAGVSAMAFSPDGQLLLSGSSDHTAQVWEVRTGKRLGPRLQHAAGVLAVAFSPDGQTVLTGGYDQQLRLWQRTAVEAPAVLPHPKLPAALAYRPDGKRLVTGSWDSWVRQWDVDTGKPLGDLLRHSRSVYALAWSSDGKLLLTGSRDNTARLWDAETGQPQGQVLEHPSPVRAVAFSPDNRSVLTGCEDRRARLWDLATGRPRDWSCPHRDMVTTVAFSPDGGTFVTVSKDWNAQRWNARTGEPLGSVLYQEDMVLAAAFDPNGKTILMGGWDRLAHFCDADTGTLLPTSLPHQGIVRAVAFSPDGKMVLTGSGDKTARLWDVVTGQPLGSPLPHQGAIQAVAFSPTGRTVATSSTDNNVRIWRVPAPVPGDTRHVAAWAQVLTGMELDAAGGIRWLPGPSWQERCQSLGPGPAWPLP
jgi:WD40 repeat protein/serine/threonine protein kinase